MKTCIIDNVADHHIVRMFSLPVHQIKVCTYGHLLPKLTVVSVRVIGLYVMIPFLSKTCQRATLVTLSDKRILLIPRIRLGL